MNAIILAAGMGTRLRPLTDDIPKCMVPVNGTPIVERQIQFLHEAGIRDITLVTGYQAEKLAPLRDRYGVRLVSNPRYDSCNNIYSLYSARDWFSGTYMIEGDVYLEKNCFTTDLDRSTYFSAWKDEEVNEWGLETDDTGRLTHIRIGKVKGYVMSGISYWTPADCARILARLDEVMANRDYTGLFWDQLIVELYPELQIQVRRCDHLHEIDTEKELRTLEAFLREKVIL